MAAAPFPSPRDDDPEDVHWALTTALSLQARGDHGEALRWLRKAVAAAVASDRDTRAIELGRSAADIEDTFSVAPTGRGEDLEIATDPDGVPSALTRLELGRLTLDSASDDDLDQPTHVDLRRHSPEARGSGYVAATGSQVQQDGVDSVTSVPFTVKAAGVASSQGGVRRVAPPEARSDRRTPLPAGAARTVHSEAHGAGDEEVDLDEEHTLAVRFAPNADELGSAPASQERHDKTLPAMSALMRFRVALVASSDGGEARVIFLRTQDSAPEGSGVAMLIPASTADGERIAALLAGRDGRR